MAFLGDWGTHWLGPTWSLAVEEQFYLLLPLLIYFVRGRWFFISLCAIVVLVPFIRLWVYLYVPTRAEAAYFLLPCRADALLLGVLCAIGYRIPAVRNWCVNNPKTLQVASLVFFVPLIFFTLYAGSRRSFEMITFGYTAISLFYASFLLAAVTNGRGFLSRLLGSRVLRFAGTLAYSVYLFHCGFNALIHGVFFHQTPRLTTWSHLGATMLALLVTTIFALLSFQFVERPFIRFGHRFPFSHDVKGEEVPEIVAPDCPGEAKGHPCQVEHGGSQDCVRQQAD